MTSRTSADAKSGELVLAWQDLDAALRAFFARRVPAAEVDDLLQECFLKVSQGLAKLRQQERLDAWIFRIAHNLVIDFRRRSRSVRESGLDPSERTAEAEPPDLDARIGGWLAATVERLPAKYADVLRDSELLEIPHREIAERLGLSISGVKSRVQRGRAMLRERLLACCALEFDRRGRIRDFERNGPTACRDC